MQHDIANGYISVESARRDYGAVVDKANGEIDRKATDEKRKKLKSKRKRDRIFIDQKKKPFARNEFRILYMDEDLK